MLCLIQFVRVEESQGLIYGARAGSQVSSSSSVNIWPIRDPSQQLQQKEAEASPSQEESGVGSKRKDGDKTAPGDRGLACRPQVL